MNNYKLLEKYRKKLSIYFALFVLFSIWVIQAIFLLLEYIPENLSGEKYLEKRLNAVVNVIKNQDQYNQKINENDKTLEKILSKTLENVIVYSCEQKVCNNRDISNINIDDSFIFTKGGVFFDYEGYKFIKKYINLGVKSYLVIIKIENEYTLLSVIKNYLYFIIFSIPFSMFFYFIGYYFVGKNFKPIKETIAGLEDFTANINHEMKTPLAEIISSLSLAKKLKNYDEAIDNSLTSSKKLNKILDSMIGIVNLVDSSYKKERFDLIKEIKGIVEENKLKIKLKNLTVKDNFINQLYFLNINREHFNICVGNLLKNAIKYSNKKGIIELKFINGVLEIKDYGRGIEKKNLKKIFNRYFRENYAKGEGYGLGLALVKKIVELHGWKVILESDKVEKKKTQGGTKVIISFIK